MIIRSDVRNSARHTAELPRTLSLRNYSRAGRRALNMRSPRLLSCCAFCLSLLPLGSLAHAGNVSWRFPFGGDWNSAANWLPGHVPGSADTALITVAGTYTVTAGSGTAIDVAKLVLGNASGAQRLSASQTSITTSQGLFVRDEGTLQLLTTSLAGPVTNDATIEFLSPTTFPPGFTTMPGSSTKLWGYDDSPYEFPAGFTNHGTIQALTDGAYIYVNFGGSFNNAADGTVTFSQQGGMYPGELVFSGNIVNDGRVHFGIQSWQAGTILNRNSWFTFQMQAQGPILNEGSMEISGTVSGMLENRDSLRIIGGLHVGGSLVLTRGEVLSSGTLSVSGTLSGDSISLPLPVSVNSCHIQANSLRIPVYTTFTMYGSTANTAITVDGRLTAEQSTLNGPTVVNTGLPPSSCSACGVLEARDLTATAGITNDGTVTIPSGYTLTMQSPFENQPGGVLSGDGTLDITGGSLAQNGAISPGSSPGVLRIDGDVALPSSSTLVIDIAGRTFGTQYDHLAISNTVALGGTLKVQMAPGFTPVAGDRFLILTATSVSGEFDEIVGTGPSMIPVYGSDRVELVVGVLGIDPPVLPQRITLAAPFPNPAGDRLRVVYALPTEAQVRLAVYDLQGREVTELERGVRPAGKHAVLWSSGSPRWPSAGVYFVRLEVDGRHWIRRAVIGG